jgi:16S rRNA pseudouridine516 synthase
MNASEILYSQGFGTRRHCIALVEAGWFEINVASLLKTQSPINSQPAYLKIIHPFEDLRSLVLDALAPSLSPDHSHTESISSEGLIYKVDQQIWTYYPSAIIMLNKPLGIECSQKPSHWPSVYTLLPSPLRCRPRKGSTPGVQAVGRLDQDTSGLLLLSDDGQFIHQMSSPKHHIAKVYQVTTQDIMSQQICPQLMSGVLLKDEREEVRAQHAELTGERSLRLEITEGKYHQVRRMLAATGHKVVQLHRSQIGGLKLPERLKPGHWDWLSPAEIDLLFKPSEHTTLGV